MAWRRKDDKTLSEPMVLYTNEQYYGITFTEEAFYHLYFYVNIFEVLFIFKSASTITVQVYNSKPFIVK